MATEKWIAGSGAGLTWTDAVTAAGLNSIGSSNALLSDTQIDNSVALDIFADFSINLGSAAFQAPNYLGLYLYPLNKDGSTYGDGQFTSSAIGPPASTYWVGNIMLVPATQAQEGTLRSVILPPGKFKMVFYNAGGVTWAGSGGNTCQYRTYNRQVA